MPVIGIPIKMLLERVGTSLDRESMVEHLQHLGCDMEGFATVRRYRCLRCDNMIEITATENPPVLCDRCGADYKEHPQELAEAGELDVIRMELLPVRPDMFEPGGLARVLRNYLGEVSSPARYELSPPTCSVKVDPGVDSEACRRPFIACAIVREITLNDDLIKTVMKLQENLHWAMGRDRKHASIGVYDLDTVQGPGFTYRAAAPDELRFVPLGLDPARPEDALTPQQILEQHPKGKAYAKLLASSARYPLLSDAAGQVLSMPPIINSEATRVGRDTKSFFIDVTGSGERVVQKALNVIVTSLAELDPGARLEQVTIVYPDRQTVTPDLTPQTVELDPQMVARTIGVELSRADVERHLRQMGHAVDDPGQGPQRVEVPAYRNDIMHPIDLVEDVAIAYGYHNVVPVMVPTMTVGKEMEVERHKDISRRAMIGLGFMETLSLTLSSEEADFDRLQLPRRDDCVQIDNPISVEQTIIRTTLVPGLLDTFSNNTSHELPQLIFEVGNISLLAAEAETGAREWPRVAAGAIGPRVDYAQIRSTCQALLREFSWGMEVVPDPAPCYIGGRGARVFAVRGDERHEVGTMGELHPVVLEEHKLVHPVSLFEVDLNILGRCESSSPTFLVGRSWFEDSSEPSRG
jgi:phenylalanyl-tRNA synthetase beta chain